MLLVKNLLTGSSLELESPYNLSSLNRIGVDENFQDRLYVESGYDSLGFGLDGYMYLEELREFIEHIKKLNNASHFDYMMLGRLQQDCEYFLGYGFRDSKRLSGSPEDHILEMKRIWKSFPENGKPEWLTWEQILDYEQKMSPEITSIVSSIYQICGDLDLMHLRGFIDSTTAYELADEPIAYNEYAEKFYRFKRGES